jgi:hypothetical protein
MADTTFSDFSTVILASWLQDVNNLVYRGIANGGAVPVTPAQVLTALGLNSGGTTAGRPATPFLYQSYFDTVLGQPVWCSQVSPAIWVNAAGVAV